MDPLPENPPELDDEDFRFLQSWAGNISRPLASTTAATPFVSAATTPWTTASGSLGSESGQYNIGTASGSLDFVPYNLYPVMYENHLELAHPLSSLPTENQQIAELRAENARLLLQVEALNAQVATLQDTYALLLAHVPGPVISDNTLEPLNHSDYPNVKFWFRHDWMGCGKKPGGDGSVSLEPQPSLRGKGRASQNINVMMRYIEDKDGQVVDGNKATSMRSFARSIWIGLDLDSCAPMKWGQADSESKNKYYRDMANRFFELRLCDADWKAELIATEFYPQWRAKWPPTGSGPTKRVRKAPKTALKTLKPLVLGAMNTPGPVIGLPDPTQEVMVDATQSRFTRLDDPVGIVASDHAAGTIPRADNRFAFSNLPLDRSVFPAVPFVTAPALDRDSTMLSLAVAPGLEPTPVVPRRFSRMRPTMSTTARNLCAKVWRETHRDGSTEEFRQYWDNLPEAELKRFNELSAELRHKTD